MPALVQRTSTMVKQVWKQIERRDPQGNRAEVEFFALYDNGPMSTGKKIEKLFELCRGQYICTVADDDRIADDYLASILAAIEESPGVDVITFDHTYYVNGELVALTKQIPGGPEAEFDKKAEDPCAVHHRLPGPMCPVRRGLAVNFEHANISDGEDSCYKKYVKQWAKTYHRIDKVLYHHLWNTTNKKERDALKGVWHRW